MLKMSQIDHFFDHIIGNDEGLNPKPAPDIYLSAFERLGINPEEAIIVEDAPHGIEAAKASGAQVIAVRGFEDVNLSLFCNLNLL
jgi:HAD superfamily hydrolase (TIGR01509 family)